MANIVPSPYQSAIFEFVRSGTGHGLVDAVPGSGKTTTLVEAAKLIPPGCRAIFLAFNKHIAAELGKQLLASQSPMEASTIHSLGMQALRGLGKRLSVQERKYHMLAKAYLESERAYDYALLTQYKKLIAFTQMTLADATSEEQLLALIDHYGLELSPYDEEWPLLRHGVKLILEKGIEQARTFGSIDFNDMVWLPSVLGLAPAQADWLFVDECQDLNAAQLALVTQSVHGHGRLLFVGDKRQSLYGFAGADTQSVNTIIKRTEAHVLPLSICYRCPKSHVALCADIFPGIEAAPWAKSGTITSITEEHLEQHVHPGDLIICRTTAPLVETCLSLLRAGVRAKVRGRDIGANFITLLNKLKKQPAFQFVRFVDVLLDYRQQQALLIGIGKDAEMKIAHLDDKVDTILALHSAYLDTLASPSLATLPGFQDYIDNFFSDERGRMVVLSTVHKAKGLEEERVFVLRPDLMPHPKAKGGWQMEQENNIRYVAYSRAKDALFLVQHHANEKKGEPAIDRYQEQTPTEAKPATPRAVA